MPHPKKKQRLIGDDTNYLVVAAASRQMTASANDLNVELLADIFVFLGGAKDIMQKRQVCKKWKEAVKITIAPPSAFYVNSMKKYNAMEMMTTEMPNLQQITIGPLGIGHKYSDGEDPNEDDAARSAHWTAHDILIADDWYGRLSRDSPDWYESVDEHEDTPPFYVCFIKAGPRIRYRWETIQDKPCEVNWLDPEPESGTIDYYDYASGYQRIQRQISLYRGYYEPPTEEQYILLYEEYLAEIQSDDDEEMNA